VIRLRTEVLFCHLQLLTVKMIETHTYLDEEVPKSDSPVPTKCVAVMFQ
jgi:hypothetical protein